MKIAIIHGQSHKGSTYHIGKMLAEKLAKEEEMQEFFLPTDLNHFCAGCYQCVEDESACPYYEEKNRIMEAIKAAELIIFTTPTYCLRASAPMKSFLDLTFTYWMSHKPKAYMFQKRAVVISTAAGAGAKSAVKDITTALRYWGVSEVYRYGIAIRAIGWKEIETKTRAKIEKRMETLAKRIGKKGTPKISLKVRGLFLMMRMMQKAGWGASEREREYWQKQGWLDKARPY